MSELPPFDKNSACPKCGDARADVQWCTGILSDGYCIGRRIGDSDDQEHMHRECQVCGFLWFEAPRDSAPKVRAQIIDSRGGVVYEAEVERPHAGDSGDNREA